MPKMSCKNLDAKLFTETFIIVKKIIQTTSMFINGSNEIMVYPKGGIIYTEGAKQMYTHFKTGKTVLKL